MKLPPGGIKRGYSSARYNALKNRNEALESEVKRLGAVLDDLHKCWGDLTLKNADKMFIPYERYQELAKAEQQVKGLGGYCNRGSTHFACDCVIKNLAQEIERRKAAEEAFQKCWWVATKYAARQASTEKEIKEMEEAIIAWRKLVPGREGE